MYIKTDQLDGETDLKPRTEIDMFKEMDIDQIRNYEVVFNFRKNKLDEFEGKIREIPEKVDENETDDVIIKDRQNVTLDEGTRLIIFDRFRGLKAL